MVEPASESPICTSVLVCDDVYRDGDTGKIILVGVFAQVLAPSFPFQPTLSVWFSLTNVQGSVDLRLSIEHDDGDVAMEIRGPLEVDNPLHTLDHSVRLVGIPFQKAGKHWACIWSGEELLGRRPFEVIRAPSEAP